MGRPSKLSPEPAIEKNQRKSKESNARGGKRPGSGRKKGSATKRTREIADRAAEEGITPLEFMLNVMRVEFTPKQSRRRCSPATEILYGGAAGGGKSYFMRALAILLCGLIPGLNVYLFRRIYDDLIKNHMEGTGGFPVMLAPLILSGHVKIVAEEIRFWNGSRIFLCHCEHEKHRFKYQGARSTCC
jgi:hypothetical protein